MDSPAAAAKVRSGRAAGIVERFTQWADRTPDSIALVEGSTRLSYGDLASWSDRLAPRLIASGVRPGDRVGVCLPRSARLIAALIAILKSGAAYLPMDPGDPRPRLGELIEDGDPAAVICDPAGVPDISGLGRPLLHPVDGGPGPSPDCPLSPGKSEDLAYLMYTSGSTGRPKAVMVEHRNIVNLVTKPSYVRINPEDRLLQLAPVTFDAATFEIWGALLNGACLVLAPPGSPDAAELAAVVRDSRITVLWLSAALFHQQIDEELDTFRTLRTVSGYWTPRCTRSRWASPASCASAVRACPAGTGGERN